MTLDDALALYGACPSDPINLLTLVTAAKVAAKWRKDGPNATALVLDALHRRYALSWRAIEAQTGIPHVTAQRLVANLHDGRWTA